MGLIVGVTAISWLFIGRPEFGDVNQKIAYFMTQLNSSRVVIAFAVDIFLFAIFQIVLMSSIIPSNSPQRPLRFIPFFGLAFWLII